MRTRTFNIDQVGGMVLIGSAVIMFAGAAVANFTLALSQTSFAGEPEQILAAIATFPSAWRLADILILVAILLTALGIFLITPGFVGPAHTWALAGSLIFSFSAVFGSVRRIISIYLEPWAAVEGLGLNNTTVEAFSRFGEGLGEWFTILAYLAITFCGMAFPRIGSNAAGWFFIAAGAAGLLLHFLGAGIPAFIFLETGALGGAVLWHERHSDSTETLTFG